jgi:hypothetical protein
MAKQVKSRGYLYLSLIFARIKVKANRNKGVISLFAVNQAEERAMQITFKQRWKFTYVYGIGKPLIQYDLQKQIVTTK